MAFKSVVRKTTYIIGDTSFEGRGGLARVLQRLVQASAAFQERHFKYSTRFFVQS
jgi:hypothetical protein